MNLTPFKNRLMHHSLHDSSVEFFELPVQENLHDITICILSLPLLPPLDIHFQVIT